MKKFIQLLFKKRFKILKNKKGFSLIEVLVAVAIIGIISAIAVPQFIAQKDEAAKVAGDTSAGNIAKAFKNCIALNSFGSCDSLSEIRVSCPAGATCDGGGPAATAKFCAHIHKGDTGSDFKVCVSIDSAGNEERSYGGALMKTAIGNVCHTTISGCTANTNDNQAELPDAGLTTCTVPGDCGTTPQANTPSTGCTLTRTCKEVTTDGDCDKTNGTCS